MATSEDFILMVWEMRKVQRAYKQNKTARLYNDAVKCAQRVDEFLVKWQAEKIQLELWASQARTDNSAGAYNFTNEKEAEETKTA